MKLAQMSGYQAFKFPSFKLSGSILQLQKVALVTAVHERECQSFDTVAGQFDSA